MSAQSGPIFSKPLAARGMAIDDFDNDGALDVVTSTNRGTFIFWNKMHSAKGGATKK